MTPDAVSEHALTVDEAVAIEAEAGAAGIAVRERERRILLAYTALRRVVVPLAVLGAWAGVSQSRLVGSLFLPSFPDLWKALNDMGSALPHALAASVTMTLIGFVIGVAVGIGLGLAMAYSRVIRELFGGILDFIRPVPVFALIPMFVLWFGIGRAPQITLIALGTSVILGVTTIEAIRNVPAVYIKAALTLGARRSIIYRDVIVPSIVPHLLGAIRVAAAASWGLDVAAEFIGAQTGLGQLMIIRQNYLDTASIIVIVIIYSLLALALDTIIRGLERPLTRWTERHTTAGVVASIVGRA